MPDYAKTLEQELLLDGRMFTDEADVDATSLDFLLHNPIDSGIELITFAASVSHDDAVTVVVYDQVSNVSGGTAQDAENNFIGHPRTEDAEVTLDPTFDGDNEHSRISYPGEGTEDVLSGVQLSAMEGESILVSVIDESGSAKVMSALFSWGEIKKDTFR